MQIRSLALAAALAALAGCDNPAAPFPDEGPARVLVFSGGGFGTGAHRVEARGDTVVLTRIPWEGLPGGRPDSVRTVPTAAAWRAFWDAADQAGVRRWESRYRAENIVDGYGWSLDLAAGGSRVRSTGSNAYPDRRGREHEGESTPEFRAFVAALEALAGAPLNPRR
jgi:hypothetical protein